MAMPQLGLRSESSPKVDYHKKLSQALDCLAPDGVYQHRVTVPMIQGAIAIGYTEDDPGVSFEPTGVLQLSRQPMGLVVAVSDLRLTVERRLGRLRQQRLATAILNLSERPALPPAPQELEGFCAQVSPNQPPRLSGLADGQLVSLEGVGSYETREFIRGCCYHFDNEVARRQPVTRGG